MASIESCHAQKFMNFTEFVTGKANFVVYMDAEWLHKYHVVSTTIGMKFIAKMRAAVPNSA